MEYNFREIERNTGADVSNALSNFKGMLRRHGFEEVPYIRRMEYSAINGVELFVRIVFCIFLFHICVPLHGQSTIYIDGHVYDRKTRNELPGATVQLLSSDSTIIATKTAYSESRNDGVVTKSAWYNFEIPKRAETYILKCSHTGYTTTYTPLKIDNIRRRETRRSLPPILLSEESTMLDEVAVSATKIKFYYRGDTVVYNADAFVLSEGSMLDALVRQLPGVEMRDNGDIYHDGKLVESILLNGKDFFRDDISTMRNTGWQTE